jgi:thiamine-phosphate diphosphorylase
MNPTMQSMLVTDRRRFGLSLEALVERAARAGTDAIQVRERDLPDRDLVELVRAMVRATADRRTHVLVNDRADIAIAAGAAGVHLRSDSAAGARVRALLPAGCVLGRSVHSLSDVDAALADASYDYLLFGTVFQSGGKAPDHPVAGLDALAAACRRSAIPVIAIGGLDAARIDAVAKAGAAGFAGVGMFM